MAISFNQVPNNQKVPFVYVEFDNTRASQATALQPYKVLAMGQKLSAGTKAELVLDRITSASQARSYYGAGSMLAKMCAKYLELNTAVELTAIAIDDHASGVDATGQVALSGTATAAGTLNVYIGAQRYQVAVAVGDTAATVATALGAAITADADRVADAVVSTADVDLTARNAGLVGNEIDIRVNYYSEDETPAGITAAVTAFSSGATNPDVSEILAVLGEEQYNLIINPWLDSANLSAMEVELEDRFGPLRQNDGYMISGIRDSLSNLATFGAGKNSKFLVAMTIEGPNSPYEWAASVAAKVALAGQLDPARPFQTLELTNILAPIESERFTAAERNILLGTDGISTYNVDRAGTVRIERLITTYKTNAFGAEDRSYFDLNTLLTLSYLRFSFRNRFATKYPRHKLASDGVRVAPGQAILTPKSAKAEAVGLFREWEELGLVEGIEQFKSDLIVERNAQDPNRLDFLLPPDLVNQLRVVGAQIQFLL